VGWWLFGFHGAMVCRDTVEKWRMQAQQAQHSHSYSQEPLFFSQKKKKKKTSFDTKIEKNNTPET
jgi:hypothetical protein